VPPDTAGASTRSRATVRTAAMACALLGQARGWVLQAGDAHAAMELEQVQSRQPTRELYHLFDTNLQEKQEALKRLPDWEIEACPDICDWSLHSPRIHRLIADGHGFVAQTQGGKHALSAQHGMDHLAIAQITSLRAIA